MQSNVKIAVVQNEPRLMKNEENLRNILHSTKEAAHHHANLIVFPECSLTGYVFQSREEASPFSETVPGPSTDRLSNLCRELKVHVIFGLLERENDSLYNAAALIGPQGFISGYRKNHLPILGVDRFVDVGDKPFTVYQTPIGNIGLEICYDIAFPEASRVMALLGADILVVPANFPKVIGDKLNYMVMARAIENTVHVVLADRIGNERGCSFAGLSKIVDSSGEIVSLANPDKEEIIYGEISLELARQKHLVLIPGEMESNRIKDRRPDLYNVITESARH